MAEIHPTRSSIFSIPPLDPPHTLPPSSQLKQYHIVGNSTFRRRFIKSIDNTPDPNTHNTLSSPKEIILGKIDRIKPRFSTVGCNLESSRNQRTEALIRKYKNRWMRLRTSETKHLVGEKSLERTPRVKPSDAWMFDLRDYKPKGVVSARNSHTQSIKSKALSDYRSIESLTQRLIM